MNEGLQKIETKLFFALPIAIIVFIPNFALVIIAVTSTLTKITKMSETQTAEPKKSVKFLWSFNTDLHRKMKQISEADNRSMAAEVRALIARRHKELFPQDGTNLDHAVTYPQLPE